MLNRDLEERVNKGTHNPCIQANIMLDREAKLNDVKMMSISLNMLSGGFETFSAVTTWAIAYLATHPEIQYKAYKAITDLHSSKSPLCDPNDDQKCDYVRALVRESLRRVNVSPSIMTCSSNVQTQVLYSSSLIPASGN
ncbi:hypothetical protein SNK03_004139 [Fusarium graminearum]